MPALESHNALALVWSGPGSVRPVLFASSLGFSLTEPLGAAATLVSPSTPDFNGPPLPGRGLSAPGQRLGPYRLIERLGCGCQGEVWRAIATEPGAVEVALKLLSPAQARDPRRLAQFRREAERGARLDVPSVLPTSECGEADGFLFMAMPLVDGCSLADVLARRRGGGRAELSGASHPLADAPEADYLRGVVRVVAQVARALEYVHASGVVHRDIKPANILLDRRREGGVFLCDFGLARDLDVATPEQLRDGAGTPLYMPPERLLRHRADETLCDIYALGATLYEAVTLVPPIHVPESLPWPAWTIYLASTTPARPRSVRPGLSDALEAIIVSAMAHDPAHRHPTAARLADDLERFLECGSVSQYCGSRTVATSANVSSSPSIRADGAHTPAFAFQGGRPVAGDTSLSRLSVNQTQPLPSDVDACMAPIGDE